MTDILSTERLVLSNSRPSWPMISQQLVQTNATTGCMKSPFQAPLHEPAACVPMRVLDDQTLPGPVWTMSVFDTTTVMLVFGLSLLLPFLTLTTTTYLRQKRLAAGKEPKLVPVIPYMIPFLCHVLSLATNPADFISENVQRYGWRVPLGIKAGPLEFTAITNPEHIKAIFRSSKQLTSKPAAIFSLTNLLDAPPAAIRFYEADDSGMGVKPRKGSVTKQEDRMHFHQAHTAQKYLSGKHLDFISEKYCSILERNLMSLQSVNSEEWTELPDLYQFLQQHVFRSAVETVMGSKIFDFNPTLVEDFWAFDRNVLLFLRCLPRWLIPKAYRARDRLLSGVKRWHAYARGHSDCSKIETDDPEWDPYFGTKLIRARQNYPHPQGMKPMSADVRASEDMGLMFAANANILPCIFWYLFEALKDQSLSDRLSSEVASCMLHDGTINVGKLSEQPLLQSAYAEVLRLRVAIAMSRVSELEDFNLSGYKIPRNHPMIIFSRTPALNSEAWESTGRTQTKSLEVFDAERFLVFDQMAGGSRTRFSLEGLAGLWLPYGGGQRMCPGRHFAKNEILITFALLFSRYDIELAVGVDTDEVKPDMRWYPVGALPPTCKVPFRIKKRAATGYQEQ